MNLVGTVAGARAYIIDSLIVNNNGGVNVSGPGNFGTLVNTIVDSSTSFGVQVTNRRQQDHVEQELAHRQPGGHQRGRWRPGCLHRHQQFSYWYRSANVDGSVSIVLSRPTRGQPLLERRSKADTDGCVAWSPTRGAVTPTPGVMRPIGIASGPPITS